MPYKAITESGLPFEPTEEGLAQLIQAHLQLHDDLVRQRLQQIDLDLTSSTDWQGIASWVKHRTRYMDPNSELYKALTLWTKTLENTPN